MKLFKPRTPKALSDAEAVQFQFHSGNRQATPLEAAVAIVQTEVRMLRAAIEAGKGTKTECELRKLITEQHPSVQSATVAWEKKARQVQAGVAEMQDAEAAQAAMDKARNRLTDLNRELATRQRADMAERELDALLGQLQ